MRVECCALKTLNALASCCEGPRTCIRNSSPSSSCHAASSAAASASMVAAASAAAAAAAALSALRANRVTDAASLSVRLYHDRYASTTFFRYLGVASSTISCSVVLPVVCTSSGTNGIGIPATRRM